MMPTLAQLGSRSWMPDAASTYAGSVDYVFYFIYWVSVAMFLLVISMMTYFLLRYRHKPGRKAGTGASHSTALELTWTIIPALVMLYIFSTSFRSYIDMSTPPDYAYEINVIAQKWNWTFVYPNGASSNELHLPLDKPVKLILSSQDVIHSFFVPAFRIKKDAVPGRYNTTWVQATKLPPVRADGKVYFDIYCTEYCGTGHSTMLAKCFVEPYDQFSRWLDDAANWVQRTPPIEAGYKLFQVKGCSQCHATEPERVITGPSLRNVFGHEVETNDGTKALADENYIRESILAPGAKIVKGYQNVMPSYQGRLKDTEITALIEWLKSISDKGPKPLEQWPAEKKQEKKP